MNLIISLPNYYIALFICNVIYMHMLYECQNISICSDRRSIQIEVKIWKSTFALGSYLSQINKLHCFKWSYLVPVETILCVLCANVVTVITAISMSAVATNGTIKGGGCYPLVRKTLLIGTSFHSNSKKSREVAFYEVLRYCTKLNPGHDFACSE